MERPFLPLFFLMMLVFVLLFPAACHRATEEDKVRKVIAGVQQAAEGRNILSVLEHVSTAYQDPQGNNYDAVKGLLAYYFIRHQKVGIFIPSIEVTVTGRTANAEFQAILTGRGSGEERSSSLLPDDLGTYDFDVRFAKEEGAWKVASAKWTRSGEGEGTQ